MAAVAGLMGPVEVFALQLGEGWVLCQPEMDRLMVLNATGKIVWDLLGDGFDQQKVESPPFSRGISASQPQRPWRI